MKSCHDEQKCSPTGDLSNLLCLQSSLWPFTLIFKGPLVSPTYCFPHLPHDIRYTTFWVLQLVSPFSLTRAPLNDIAVWEGVIILQVWHLGLPQGLHSPAGSSSIGSGFSLARTRWSLRLFGHLKAMIGFCWKTVLRWSDDSMMDQCLSTMPLTLGRSGWYVITNGRTALFAVGFGLYDKRFCLSICLTFSMAWSMTCFW